MEDFFVAEQTATSPTLTPVTIDVLLQGVDLLARLGRASEDAIASGQLDEQTGHRIVLIGTLLLTCTDGGTRNTIACGPCPGSNPGARSPPRAFPRSRPQRMASHRRTGASRLGIRRCGNAPGGPGDRRASRSLTGSRR